MRPRTHYGFQGRLGLHRALRQGKMYGVSWTRYDGRALADITLQGGALLAELEDYIRAPSAAAAAWAARAMAPGPPVSVNQSG